MPFALNLDFLGLGLHFYASYVCETVKLRKLNLISNLSKTLSILIAVYLAAFRTPFVVVLIPEKTGVKLHVK